MKMKKLIAGALAMAMALSLVACGGGDKPTTSQGNTPPPSTGSQNGSQTPSGGGNDLSANLTLATYPVGKMTDETVIKGLIADFNAVYPNVKIDVIYLDYANGDQTVNSMIEGKSAPDLIFEGPERLVANWGAKGLMVDLKDLLPAGTYDVTVGSCTNADGAVYELPVCQTAHCMGINKDLFTQAGAMQYINEDTHTWKSTADFLKAVEAVAAIHPQVGVVFCGGQGGDQGTRAFIANLYDGSVADGKEYTFNSEAMIQGLTKAQEWIDKGWLGNGVQYNGGQSIELFVAGTTAYEFCWGTSAAGNNAATMEANGVTPISLPFPSADGKPVLEYLVNGFCVFDNGDDAKAEAAKTFIKWLCDNKENVTRTGAFPVLQSMGNLYPGDAEKELLVEFTKMYGPYYNTMDGFANMRAQWFDMLQKITGGGDVTELANAAVEASNAGMTG